MIFKFFNGFTHTQRDIYMLFSYVSSVIRVIIEGICIEIPAYTRYYFKLSVKAFEPAHRTWYVERNEKNIRPLCRKILLSALNSLFGNKDQNKWPSLANYDALKQGKE